MSDTVRSCPDRIASVHRDTVKRPHRPSSQLQLFDGKSTVRSYRSVIVAVHFRTRVKGTAFRQLGVAFAQREALGNQFPYLGLLIPLADPLSAKKTDAGGEIYSLVKY